MSNTAPLREEMLTIEDGTVDPNGRRRYARYYVLGREVDSFATLFKSLLPRFGEARIDSNLDH